MLPTSKYSDMKNVKFEFDLADMGLIPSEWVQNQSIHIPSHILQSFCEYVMDNKTIELERINETFCPAIYDGFYCWAPTESNTRPVRRCPGPEYTDNPLQPAYRYCRENGVWDNKTNYDRCYGADVILGGLYFSGFTLSFISLAISLAIFLYFKSLRCLRNHIHSNLIGAFLLRALAYFAVYSFSQYVVEQSKHVAICNILHFITNFAMLSNHIWMVMEGLYLFLIILCTFSIERLKFWHFAVMGWGLSGLLTGIHYVVSLILYPNSCWNAVDHLSPISWILNGPIIASLIVNTLFLVYILYSLVIKVRASQRYRPTAVPTHSGETTLATEYRREVTFRESSQWRRVSRGMLMSRVQRKALKAMLVLFPLLGIGYILFLIPPYEAPELKKIYNYIHAIMLSTQGFFVALIYCFLNSEVRSVIQTHYSHWGQTRTLFRNRQCSLGTGGASIQNRRSSRSANCFLSADNRRNSPEHRSHSIASARSLGAQSYNGIGESLIFKSSTMRHQGSIEDSTEGLQQETALYLSVPSANIDQTKRRTESSQESSLRRNGTTE